MFPDAHPPDAPLPTSDAPPDAPPAAIDAPPATFSGTISIQDIQLLAGTGAGGVIVVPNSGHGGNITVSFTQNGIPTEETVGNTGIPPCFATRRDITKPEQVVTQSNEGTVSFTVSGGTVIPPCALVGGAYRCIGANGTAGAIAPVVGQTVSLFTGTATNAFGANDVGRYLSFGTAAVPIVGFDATGPTLVLQSELTVPATGAWSTVAGVGPVAFTAGITGTPKGAPPNFLQDSDTVIASFTPGAGSHFPAFATLALPVNDAWSLDAASGAALDTGLLAAAGAVRLGCKTDGGGAACGDGIGTVVAIDSTDTAVTGATDFPPATQFVGSVTCAAFDSATAQFAEIPKNLIDVLTAANPTRLRISIFRVQFSPQAAGRVNVVAGRGFVKFETP